MSIRSSPTGRISNTNEPHGPDRTNHDITNDINYWDNINYSSKAAGESDSANQWAETNDWGDWSQDWWGHTPNTPETETVTHNTNNIAHASSVAAANVVAAADIAPAPRPNFGSSLVSKLRGPRKSPTSRPSEELNEGAAKQARNLPSQFDSRLTSVEEAPVSNEPRFAASEVLNSTTASQSSSSAETTSIMIDRISSQLASLHRKSSMRTPSVSQGPQTAAPGVPSGPTTVATSTGMKNPLGPTVAQDSDRMCSTTRPNSFTIPTPKSPDTGAWS